MIPTLFCVGVLFAVFVCIAWVNRERNAFNERFPPISDAEFLACCPPGANPEVTLKVRRIVAKHFGIEYERVYPSTTFVEDLSAG